MRAEAHLLFYYNKKNEENKFHSFTLTMNFVPNNKTASEKSTAVRIGIYQSAIWNEGTRL